MGDANEELARTTAEVKLHGGGWLRVCAARTSVHDAERLFLEASATAATTQTRVSPCAQQKPIASLVAPLHVPPPRMSAPEFGRPLRMHEPVLAKASFSTGSSAPLLRPPMVTLPKGSGLLAPQRSLAWLRR